MMPELSRDAETLRSQALAHLYGLYYTCPDLYDGQRALELARRAVLLDPRNKDARGMLGVALYRNGRYDEAMKTLLEVLPSRTEDPNKLLFLAMTSHELGKRSEARRYYDRAVAWMKSHFPSDVESLRLRGEAQKALGLAE
jgi:tetratricopeptide (TPR) repeat protein